MEYGVSVRFRNKILIRLNCCSKWWDCEGRQEICNVLDVSDRGRGGCSPPSPPSPRPPPPCPAPSSSSDWSETSRARSHSTRGPRWSRPRQAWQLQRVLHRATFVYRRDRLLNNIDLVFSVVVNILILQYLHSGSWENPETPSVQRASLPSIDLILHGENRIWSIFSSFLLHCLQVVAVKPARKQGTQR